MQFILHDSKIEQYGLNYATPGSAGLDLRASMTEQFDLYPRQRHTFNTGVAVQIGDLGTVGFITSRSGLNHKHGIRVSQGVGTIDSDYTDELKVILINDGPDMYTIEPYERIAQIVFMPVVQVDIDIVDEFSYTTQRDGGLGSTGRL